MISNIDNAGISHLVAYCYLHSFRVGSESSLESDIHCRKQDIKSKHISDSSLDFVHSIILVFFLLLKRIPKIAFTHFCSRSRCFLLLSSLRTFLNWKNKLCFSWRRLSSFSWSVVSWETVINITSITVVYYGYCMVCFLFNLFVSWRDPFDSLQTQTKS